MKHAKNLSRATEVVAKLKRETISKREKKLIMKAFEAGFNKGLFANDSKDDYMYMQRTRLTYVRNRFIVNP